MFNVTFLRYNKSDKGKCNRVMEQQHDKSTKMRQITHVEERSISIGIESTFAMVLGQGNCEWAYLCFNLYMEI